VARFSPNEFYQSNSCISLNLTVVKIIAIEPESQAERAGIRVGDDLVSINGQPVTDILDYYYWQAEEELDLVLKRGSNTLNLHFLKTYDEDLGLELQPPRLRSCGNNCIFCFIKQNPPGMRPSIYFHDEDYRYSFLHGTYITLTNLREVDLERIAQLRLSPLYISVHATDDEVRRHIFQIKKSDNFLAKLSFLREHRIDLHVQIVLLPGINDGAILEQTLRDLYQYREVILSVAIVPVGLTRHRGQLPDIQPVNKPEAVATLARFKRWKRWYRNRDGQPWVFLSDEFYLLAGERLPGAKFYGNYYQIENGVGLTRQFLESFKRQARRLPKAIAQKKRLLFITGTLAAPVLESHVLPVLRRITNFQVDILPVINNFFGQSVTVAGLLVGQDIIEQAKHRRRYDQIVLPPRCTNHAGLLLDDLTPQAIARQLQTQVAVFDGNFLQLVRNKDG
jgi:putative radical SAM enzyme (TIGR03279 family)